MNLMDVPALKGVRVLELGHAIAAPQAAQILGDHGADVIKIEPPSGEMARRALPRKNGESIYFSTHNRNKRSVVLDLKSKGDLGVLFRLVETADILLTNYSVDVPARLGWDYETLKTYNNRIVFVHITGFGSSSPNAHKKAIDGVVQSLSGIADLTGTEDSGPVHVGAFVADHIAAYHAAMASILALRRRDLTDKSEFVDINMLSSYMATGAHAIGAAADGQPLMRSGNRVPTAFSNAYEATDGYVFVSPVGEKAWKALRRATAIPEISELDYEDAIGEWRQFADQAVAEWCGRRTRKEVFKVLDPAGVACAPIRTMSDAVTSAADFGSSIVVVESPGGQEIHVPGPLTAVGLTDSPRRHTVAVLGEHTEEILAELGMSNNE